MKKFSRHQLSRLRNDISINILICDILKIPNEVSKGQLRFLCPICTGFNTSTKLKTNLARCYDCSINFNTIEMVMNTKGVDFLPAATFLTNYLDQVEQNTVKNHSSVEQKPPLLHRHIKRVQKDLNYPLQNVPSSQETGNSDQSIKIRELENKVCQLSKQVEQLKEFIIREFCQKSKLS